MAKLEEKINEEVMEELFGNKYNRQKDDTQLQ